MVSVVMVTVMAGSLPARLLRLALLQLSLEGSRLNERVCCGPLRGVSGVLSRLSLRSLLECVKTNRTNAAYCHDVFLIRERYAPKLAICVPQSTRNSAASDGVVLFASTCAISN
jgi:hypothetical protein